MKKTNAKKRKEKKVLKIFFPHSTTFSIISIKVKKESQLRSVFQKHKDRKLLVNILLVEVIEKMLDYFKFMNDLLINRRTISFELVDKLHHCSTITSRSIVKKNKGLGSLTISCTIGAFNFTKALLT